MVASSSRRCWCSCATVSPIPTSASGQCGDYCHKMPGSDDDKSCAGSVCDSRKQICCLPGIEVEVEIERGS